MVFDKIFGKKEEKKEEKKPTNVFDEPCALCSDSSTDTKWMGQYWHKKCKRKAKKMAKGML